MSSPLSIKTAEEIKSQMIEHVVGGIIYQQDELHKNDPAAPTYPEDDPASNYYELRCGLPDITNGELVSVERIWGMRDDSFYEFQRNTDYTIDTTTNSITFINDPDAVTNFYVSYRYDQKYTSKISNVGRGTVNDMILTAVSRVASEGGDNTKLVKDGAYVNTAVGDDLDQIAALINITRNPANPAEGFVTVFRNGTSGNSVIPIGAKFSTSAIGNAKAIVFESIEAGLFVDGFSSAILPIRATSGYEGRQGNIAPNKIVNILSGAGSSIRVNNPDKYTTEEFMALLEGKYIYFLNNLPERSINTQSYPPAVLDKGFYSVSYFTDKDLIEGASDWVIKPAAVGDVTITPDTPVNGVTEFDITSISNTPYVAKTSLTIPRHTGLYAQGYDHVFIRIRGDSGDTFSLTIRDGVISDFNPILRKFNDGQAGSATPALEDDFKVFLGPHGLSNVLDSGSDGETTDATGTFDTPGGGLIAAGVTTDHTLIITSGADIGRYRIISRDSDTSLTIDHTFAATASALTWTVEQEDDIIEVRIEFLAVGKYYIDWIAIGTFLEEVSPVDLDSEDELSLSYTSSRLSLNKEATPQTKGDFFFIYDGDSADGHSDELLIYYQWRNVLAGGADVESDELLRERIKISFSSFGKGTKNSIRGAILDIDGVAEAIVQDFDDDPSISPGDINVFVLSEGFKLSSSLQNEIIATIDAYRAAGIRANLFLPEIRYTNFELNIVYDNVAWTDNDSAGQLALKNIIGTVIDDFFADNAKINQNLYYSDLIGFIINQVDVVIGGYVTFTDAVEPTYSDDDFDTGYAFGSGVVFEDPLRITASKSGVSIVVQRGNFANSLINLIFKSSQ